MHLAHGCLARCTVVTVLCAFVMMRLAHGCLVICAIVTALLRAFELICTWHMVACHPYSGYSLVCIRVDMHLAHGCLVIDCNDC